MSQKVMKMVGATLLLGFCVYMVFRGGNRAEKLKERHEVINGGYVYSCTYEGRGNAGHVYLNFYFKSNGDSILGQTIFLLSQISVFEAQEYFVGRFFPVVYVPSENDINDILVTPNSFRRYGYSFPDTLSWVLQYVNENEK